MNFLERVEQLRDDYRRRQKTADKMISELERKADAHSPGDYLKIKRLKVKRSLYREFADEISRIL